MLFVRAADEGERDPDDEEDGQALEDAVGEREGHGRDEDGGDLAELGKQEEPDSR